MSAGTWHCLSIEMWHLLIFRASSVDLRWYTTKSGRQDYCRLHRPVHVFLLHFGFTVNCYQMCYTTIWLLLAWLEHIIWAWSLQDPNVFPIRTTVLNKQTNKQTCQGIHKILQQLRQNVPCNRFYCIIICIACQESTEGTLFVNNDIIGDIIYKRN